MQSYIGPDPHTVFLAKLLAKSLALKYQGYLLRITDYYPMQAGRLDNEISLRLLHAAGGKNPNQPNFQFRW